MKRRMLITIKPVKLTCTKPLTKMYLFINTNTCINRHITTRINPSLNRWYTRHAYVTLCIVTTLQNPSNVSREGIQGECMVKNFNLHPVETHPRFSKSQLGHHPSKIHLEAQKTSNCTLVRRQIHPIPYRNTQLHPIDQLRSLRK